MSEASTATQQTPAKAAPAAPKNDYARYIGQPVRFHLARKFVHEIRDDEGKVVERTEHPHLNAILVAVDDKGVGTLKILPHVHGLRHLANELNAGKPEDQHVKVGHIVRVEGIPRGTKAGQWSPEG